MMGLVVGLSALALAGSVLFAASRGAPPEEAASEARDAVATPGTPETGPGDARVAGGASGAAVFRMRCRRCHSVAEAVALVEEGAADEREVFLTQLLERHFPPPPEERPELIRHLIEKSAAR